MTLRILSLCCLILVASCSAAGDDRTIPDVAITDSAIGKLRVTTVVRNLRHPWSLAFLPDGRALITERPGRLRLLDGPQVSAPIKGVPNVWAEGQGGLLDVAIDPAFAQNHRIYLSYAEAGPGGGGTAVMRATLVDGALSERQVIFRQSPKLSVGHHFGSRLVFDRAGHLFITLGENNQRETAQQLDHLQGKVVRLWPDGTIPDDNPFVGRGDARAEIWSYGHRNPQGAALNPWTGQLWVNEHGPKGGDEINISQAGKNYGWPLITFGINYDGQPIPEAQGSHADGMEAPIKYWVPSIAPSGMAFYDSPRIPAWRNSVFVGALALMHLNRQTLDATHQHVTGEERLLGEFGFRIRDVRVGPDGALYVLTDADDGRLLRIEPVATASATP